MVFLEDAAIFGVGRCADAFEYALRKRRLQKSGCIQGPSRRRAGADQGMNFINEQHGARGVGQSFQYGLEPLLEVPAILGARQKCAHVKGIHIGIRKYLWNITFHDPPRQAFCNGGLADASFANQQGIVFAPTTERLNDTLKFLVTADQRVNLSLQSQGIEVDGVLLQRAGGAIARLTPFSFCVFGLFLRLGLRYLGNAV